MTLDVRIRLMRNRKIDRKTGCWVWIGGRSKSGYGVVWWNGKWWRVHRVAMVLLKKRKIPAGKIVMHKCDNRPCFNPAHIKIGTSRENIHDCIQKGRWRKGRSVCQRGHDKTPGKPCFMCDKLRKRAWYEQHRKEILAEARLRDRRENKFGENPRIRRLLQRHSGMGIH